MSDRVKELEALLDLAIRVIEKQGEVADQAIAALERTAEALVRLGKVRVPGEVEG